MKSKSFRTLIMLLFALGMAIPIPVMRADGPSVQSQCPCGAAQIERDRRIKAENELSGVRLELKTCMARYVEELAKANRATIDAERELASARSKNVESEQTIAGQTRTIAARNETIVTVTAERDAALVTLAKRDTSIKNANGTFACEKLNLGCVDKK